MDRRLTTFYAGTLLAAAGAFAAIAVFGSTLDAPLAPTGAVTFDGPRVTKGLDPLPHVLLALLTIVVVARGVGAVFRRLGQPPVLGEMFAGILLGPSLVGALLPEVTAFLMPAGIAPLLGILAQVGVVLFLFLVGLELDTTLLRSRTQGALAISHASIVTPFVLGGLLSLLLYPTTATADVPFVPFALFVGVAMSVTAFPVLARILGECGLQRSPLGVVALACAAIDDVTAWCLLALVVGIAKASASAAGVTLLLTAAFAAVMLLGVKPLMARWVARQSDGDSRSTQTMAVLITGLLASSLATEAIGVHALFGAFLFGAVIPHDSRLAHAAHGKLTDVVVVLFLPVFFAFTGLRTHIGLVEGWQNWLLCALVVVTATVGKFGGTYMAARVAGFPRRDAAGLGALMNTRGLMELVVLNVGLDLRLISPTLFAMMVVMALATTLLTTPALRVLGLAQRADTAPDPAPPPPPLLPPAAPPTMTSSNPASDDRPWDVLICGAGFAGLLLARQLRQELPHLRVAIVERSKRPLPDACHKVGESSVELGCQYFLRLGLREYMAERQLPKMGLRFFPGGGHLPLHERAEMGPCAEPIVPSYQIDRGRIEDDLRGFAERDGVTLIEGAQVTAIDLGTGGALHRVTWDAGGTTGIATARWVVDATGRNALVRKQQKLTRPSRHVASSGWYRIAGRFDINRLVPASEKEWHSRPLADKRWLSTNHFMGDGYWVWVIPLSTGNTSIGVVIHEDTHDSSCIAGLERTQAFIEKHEPHLARELAKERVLDFLCLRNYSYSVAQSFSPDRWALVGVAGAFVDPLFSPGNDFIALANTFTVEMIRADLAGEDLKERADILNTQYRAMLVGAFEIFRQAAPVYGHAGAMSTKVFWNNFAYWSFTCQYFQQDLCRLHAADQARVAVYGTRFLELTSNVESLLQAWARMAPMRTPPPVFLQSPAFPSVLVDAHTAVARKMTLDETLAYMEQRLAQGLEIIGEIVLRIAQELGPERTRELLTEVKFASWGVPIPKQRLDVEDLPSLERRHRMPVLARDVERGLGPIRRHPEAVAAREVVAASAGG
jgi:Kef-type K+ transport system membrane component KefB/flavin-dependent dehydrogenase